MSKQSGYIVIVSASDIILSGLNSMLGDFVNFEVITAKSIEDLSNYPHLSGYIILIIEEELYRSSYQYIKKSLLHTAESFTFLLRTAHTLMLESNEIGVFEAHESIYSKITGRINSFQRNTPENKDTELSAREKEVLKSVAKGISNKEIANQLNISTHTVISHRKNICEKIGIKSAAGMTMYAVLKKIINIDEVDFSELV